MKERKSKKQKPWLTPSGVAIPTADLMQIVKSWDSGTWAAYLKWYDRPLKARLLTPGIYDKLADEQAQTIFAQFGQTVSGADKELCAALFRKLRSDEAEVLRLLFLEGKTQTQIGYMLKLSQQRVSQIKNRALIALKWGHHGEKLVAREYMRGESFAGEFEKSSVWDEKLESPLKEPRLYRPENQVAEIDSLKNSTARWAFFALSERARVILYLRYYCDLSIGQTAHRLSMGVNVAEQIEESAVSKFKRNFIQFQSGVRPGEGSIC